MKHPCIFIYYTDQLVKLNEKIPSNLIKILNIKFN